MKVTFDTNVFQYVVEPELHIEKPDYPNFISINKALRSGQFRGYFGEAMVVLDALKKGDKVDVAHSRKMVSKTYLQAPKIWTIKVGSWTEERQIPPQFLCRVQKALDLGMRALIGPRPFGCSLIARGFDDSFYKQLAPHEVVAIADKTNAVDEAILSRGAGRAQIITLGNEYNKQYGFEEDWWPRGLERATTEKEYKRIFEAVKEWADGDIIAAHIGHSNDLFCTHDRGRSAGSNSIFSATHRDWLTKTYGVKFVALRDLVKFL